MTEEYWDMLSAWENGTLSDTDTLKLFQRLVDTGDVWRLQGFYGDFAHDLLEKGLIHYPIKHSGHSGTDYWGNKIPTAAEYEAWKNRRTAPNMMTKHAHIEVPLVRKAPIKIQQPSITALPIIPEEVVKEIEKEKKEEEEGKRLRA